MIKFFRHIRQNLLMENKTSKYLKYAIGEIVLVVIGILIALQINNWNEERKSTKKEYEIMTNLAEDFKNNLDNLERFIDTIYPKWHFRLKQNISHIGLKENQLNEQIKRDIRWTGYYKTKIIDGSLNSILSSEKLELFRDNKLKNMLTAYPAEINEFKTLENNIEHYVLNVQRDIFRHYVSLADDTFFDSIIKLKVAKSDYEGLMKNMYYQNTIMGNSLVLDGLKEEAQNLKSATEEIYNLLLENIENNPNHNLNQ